MISIFFLFFSFFFKREEKGQGERKGAGRAPRYDVVQGYDCCTLFERAQTPLEANCNARWERGAGRNVCNDAVQEKKRKEEEPSRG